ncbi:MAG: hypothetical protein H0U35_12260 [Sporichthyaceae bacterium]|nr:hypothetical protein [Sporichthyaceae bacterium]
MLDAVVADDVLTRQQADVILQRVAVGDSAVDKAAPDRRGRLAEIAGYLGGALALSAAALFLGTEWSDLEDATRAAFLLVAGAVLVAGGVAIVIGSGLGPDGLGRQPDSARRRLVSTLWGLAAAALSGGVGVLVESDPAVVAAATGLLLGGVAYLLVPGGPGHVAAGLAATALVGSAVDELAETTTSTAYALSFVALAAAWATLTAARVLRERDLGFSIAALLALIGAQLPVITGSGSQGLAYALTAAVAAAGYAGFVLTRGWPVLVAGVIATTLVVPEALHDWTEGSVSVAGALLMAGLTLLAASAVGLRLSKSVR